MGVLCALSLAGCMEKDLYQAPEEKTADEYFGFTDMEVKNMLEYYGMEEHYEEVKSWYNGYQFGSVEVYCPWDVLNYCDKLKDREDSFPENYRINTI